MQDKYMAYVGSYSYNGQAKGITVYDVDVKKGKFIYRCEVEVDNSSYLTVSHAGGMCALPRFQVPCGKRRRSLPR